MRARSLRPARRPAAAPLSAALAAALAAALVTAPAAEAHGIAGRAGLPVPAWLFAWVAGGVLAGSFLALGRLWTRPRLEEPRERTIAALPAWLEPVAGAVGIAAFALVVLSGLAGTPDPARNLAPTAVFVVFWVAVPAASLLLGDVFRAVNPWRALARGAAWTARRAGLAARTGEPYPLPARLGRWPAVTTVLAFAWVELVLPGRDRPATLAALACAYALVQLVAMAAFGIEAWTERGDGFAVAFGLYGRLAPLRAVRGERPDGRLELRRRPPLAGLTGLHCLPGTVPLLAAMIGATTFDGTLNGAVWRAALRPAVHGLGHLGIGQVAAVELVDTAGLLLVVLLCGLLYLLGVRGMATVAPAPPPRPLARRFVHTLVPIAAGYLVAHYVSLLLIGGQAVGHLVSDPLGTGADLFGTAHASVDPRPVSAAVIWYLQVAALVAGHVGGVVLAHDRALTIHPDPEAALASQRWMLVVMVTFTCLGLWLLSAVNT